MPCRISLCKMSQDQLAVAHFFVVPDGSFTGLLRFSVEFHFLLSITRSDGHVVDAESVLMGKLSISNSSSSFPTVRDFLMNCLFRRRILPFDVSTSYVRLVSCLVTLAGLHSFYGVPMVVGRWHSPA